MQQAPDGNDTWEEKVMGIDKTQMDWTHSGIPPRNRLAQIWAYNQIRTGKLDQEGCYFMLDDCIHPIQNRAMPIDRIDAWRLI